MNYFGSVHSPKLLVVDDDLTYHHQLVAILRTAGIFDVTLASTAEEGIKFLQDQKKNEVYDLVLLDINMPRLDGIEACLLLTESLLMVDTPIIMVTGCDNIHRLEDAISAGAVDYVRKPLSKTILMARINLVLESQYLKKHVQELERCEYSIASVG